MSFKGFHAESKAYMDYEYRTFWARVRFWAWYPIAAVRFYWWTWQDTRASHSPQEPAE